MPTGERSSLGAPREAEQAALQGEWRRLGRAATFVAVMTSPATFAWLHGINDVPVPWSLLITFALVITFRGFIDVVAHKLIPRASLYGAGRELMDADIVSQRRVWDSRTKFRPPFLVRLVVGGRLCLLFALRGA